MSDDSTAAALPLRPPAPPTPAAHGKRVTWVELLFELVFVFAVTRVSVMVGYLATGLAFAVTVALPTPSGVHLRHRAGRRRDGRGGRPPDEHLSRVVSVLLVGGCAIFLTTFGYTRWVMFHLISRTRLTAAAAVLCLLPLSWLLPAWLTLLGMLTVLGTLTLVELRGAHQAARPVPATY